jgi:predicted nucleic acid-binding protein
VITADTNVFVYTVDPRDPFKRDSAQRVVDALEGARGRIALQVTGEFQNVVRRKLKMPRPLAARLASEILEGFETFPATRPAARAALDEMAAGRLSYWDALMLASAAEVGCTAMPTEDLQDGAPLFGLEIVNPFAAAGISPRAAQLLEIA